MSFNIGVVTMNVTLFCDVMRDLTRNLLSSGVPLSIVTKVVTVYCDV